MCSIPTGRLFLLLRSRSRYWAENERDSNQSSKSGRQFIQLKQSDSFSTKEKGNKSGKILVLEQYFKESQMRLHPERFEKKNLNQNGSQMKIEPQVKTEVKTEANKVDGFEDMDDDFDAWNLSFYLYCALFLSSLLLQTFCFNHRSFSYEIWWRNKCCMDTIWKRKLGQLWFAKYLEMQQDRKARN